MGLCTSTSAVGFCGSQSCLGKLPFTHFFPDSCPLWGGISVCWMNEWWNKFQPGQSKQARQLWRMEVFHKPQVWVAHTSSVLKQILTKYISSSCFHCFPSDSKSILITANNLWASEPLFTFSKIFSLVTRRQKLRPQDLKDYFSLADITHLIFLTLILPFPPTQ